MIVDTMVFAYAMLSVEQYRDDALAVLDKAETIAVPDSFRGEFANVLWQWVRHRDVASEFARSLLWDVESLITQVVDGGALWEKALVLAVAENHPVYDTLFVAAAELLETQVVTFDQRLKSHFPQQVFTATEFLEKTHR